MWLYIAIPSAAVALHLTIFMCNAHSSARRLESAIRNARMAERSDIVKEIAGSIRPGASGHMIRYFLAKRLGQGWDQ
jgi:hypothetical protein